MSIGNAGGDYINLRNEALNQADQLGSRDKRIRKKEDGVNLYLHDSKSNKISSLNPYKILNRIAKRHRGAMSIKQSINQQFAHFKDANGDRLNVGDLVFQNLDKSRPGMSKLALGKQSWGVRASDFTAIDREIARVLEKHVVGAQRTGALLIAQTLRRQAGLKNVVLPNLARTQVDAQNFREALKADARLANQTPAASQNVSDQIVDRLRNAGAHGPVNHLDIDLGVNHRQVDQACDLLKGQNIKPVFMNEVRQNLNLRLKERHLLPQMERANARLDSQLHQLRFSDEPKVAQLRQFSARSHRLMQGLRGVSQEQGVRQLAEHLAIGKELLKEIEGGSDSASRLAPDLKEMLGAANELMVSSMPMGPRYRPTSRPNTTGPAALDSPSALHSMPDLDFGDGHTGVEPRILRQAARGNDKSVFVQQRDTYDAQLREVKAAHAAFKQDASDDNLARLMNGLNRATIASDRYMKALREAGGRFGNRYATARVRGDLNAVRNAVAEQRKELQSIGLLVGTLNDQRNELSLGRNLPGAHPNEQIEGLKRSVRRPDRPFRFGPIGRQAQQVRNNVPAPNGGPMPMRPSVDFGGQPIGAQQQPGVPQPGAMGPDPANFVLPDAPEELDPNFIGDTPGDGTESVASSVSQASTQEPSESRTDDLYGVGDKLNLYRDGDDDNRSDTTTPGDDDNDLVVKLRDDFRIDEGFDADAELEKEGNRLPLRRPSFGFDGRPRSDTPVFGVDTQVPPPSEPQPGDADSMYSDPQMRMRPSVDFGGNPNVPPSDNSSVAPNAQPNGLVAPEGNFNIEDVENDEEVIDDTDATPMGDDPENEPSDNESVDSRSVSNPQLGDEPFDRPRRRDSDDDNDGAGVSLPNQAPANNEAVVTDKKQVEATFQRAFGVDTEMLLDILGGEVLENFSDDDWEPEDGGIELSVVNGRARITITDYGNYDGEDLVFDFDPSVQHTREDLQRIGDRVNQIMTDGLCEKGFGMSGDELKARIAENMGWPAEAVGHMDLEYTILDTDSEYMEGFELRIEGYDGIEELNAKFYPEENPGRIDLGVARLASDKQASGLMVNFMMGVTSLVKPGAFAKAKMLANISSGGYAWARYGFQPTEETVLQPPSDPSKDDVPWSLATVVGQMDQYLAASEGRRPLVDLEPKQRERIGRLRDELKRVCDGESKNFGVIRKIADLKIPVKNWSKVFPEKSEGLKAAIAEKNGKTGMTLGKALLLQTAWDADFQLADDNETKRKSDMPYMKAYMAMRAEQDQKLGRKLIKLGQRFGLKKDVDADFYKKQYQKLTEES